MEKRTLEIEAEAAKSLLANIAQVMADYATDDDLIADMVEAETGLFEAIDAALLRRETDLALAEGLSEYITTLQKRKRALEDRAEAMRVSILAAMQAAELKKVERPLATISRKPTPPSVIVVEEADIPTQFWKAQPPKLDKRELLAALKDGQDIPGALLSNGGETVQVRT